MLDCFIVDMRNLGSALFCPQGIGLTFLRPHLWNINLCFVKILEIVPELHYILLCIKYMNKPVELAINKVLNNTGLFLIFLWIRRSILVMNHDCSKSAESKIDRETNNNIFVLPWARFQYSFHYCVFLQNLPNWLLVFPTENTIGCIMYPEMLNDIDFANNSILLCKYSSSPLWS